MGVGDGMASRLMLCLLTQKGDHPMQLRFRDRVEAGQFLARKLSHYQDRPEVIILGLPRGGVPIAFELAKTLHLPWDIWPVRKLGLPGNPEIAMGAIALGGTPLLNQDVIAWKQVSSEMIQQATTQADQELHRREHLYRHDRPLPAVTGKTVILADDGIATGATMRAVIEAVRHWRPDSIVVAAPLISPSIAHQIQSEADELVTLIQPDPFFSVNLWYQDFPQVTDAEVCEMLAHTHSGADTTLSRSL